MRRLQVGGLQVYGTAGRWSGSYEAVDDRDTRRLAACPHCGFTHTLEICNTHTPSYWIECECGAQWHGGYVETGRKASRAKVIAAHRKAMDNAIRGWNRRRGTP